MQLDITPVLKPTSASNSGPKLLSYPGQDEALPANETSQESFLEALDAEDSKTNTDQTAKTNQDPVEASSKNGEVKSEVTPATEQDRDASAVRDSDAPSGSLETTTIPTQKSGEPIPLPNGKTAGAVSTAQDMHSPSEPDAHRATHIHGPQTTGDASEPPRNPTTPKDQPNTPRSRPAVPEMVSVAHSGSESENQSVQTTARRPTQIASSAELSFSLATAGSLTGETTGKVVGSSPKLENINSPKLEATPLANQVAFDEQMLSNRDPAPALRKLTKAAPEKAFVPFQLNQSRPENAADTNSKPEALKPPATPFSGRTQGAAIGAVPPPLASANSSPIFRVSNTSGLDKSNSVQALEVEAVDTKAAPKTKLTPEVLPAPGDTETASKPLPDVRSANPTGLASDPVVLLKPQPFQDPSQSSTFRPVLGHPLLGAADKAHATLPTHADPATPLETKPSERVQNSSQLNWAPVSSGAPASRQGVQPPSIADIPVAIQRIATTTDERAQQTITPAKLPQDPSAAQPEAHRNGLTSSAPAPTAATSLQPSPVPITLQSMPDSASTVVVGEKLGENPLHVARGRSSSNPDVQITQFGLGHNLGTEVTSSQQGLAASVAPLPPMPSDRLDTGEELALASSNSASDISSHKTDATTPFAQRASPAAHSILSQIQAALPKINGDTTEILLNPEELGRVRMTLSGSDGVGTVLLQVERPETLDLMRRNIEQMRAELAEAGWETVTFSFEQNNSDTSSEGHGQDEPSASRTPMQTTEDLGPTGPSPHRAGAPSTGLDLRL